MSATPFENPPVFVEGVRTPFLDSAGAYSPLMSYELGARATAAGQQAPAHQLIALILQMRHR